MTLKIDSFSGKYSFLSNFYVWSIEHEGLTYRTVEHAFQASKTLDQNERRRIANMFAPGDAKRAGRRVKLREDWEKVKVGVMLDLLRKKFAPPTLLSNALLNTDDAELIEGNTWGDRFWGVCEGEGKNILGKLLMALREELRNPKKHATIVILGGEVIGVGVLQLNYPSAIISGVMDGDEEQTQ